MNITSNRIRTIRRSLELSGTEIADKLGISAQYYYNIERGKRNLSADIAAELAKIFNVSVDYLLGLSDETNANHEESSQATKKTRNYYDLTEKDEADIAKELENLMGAIDGNNSLAFHGEVMDMSEEQKEILRISLENSLRVAKQIAKKKFTPKKYR